VGNECDDVLPRPLLPGSVHPSEGRERLAEVRVVPMDLPGEVIRLFVPEYDKIDQAKDNAWLPESQALPEFADRPALSPRSEIAKT
jgi:hypothetical protein